nr:hypothetical protein [uncultured Campylobacter sp.]
MFRFISSLEARGLYSRFRSLKASKARGITKRTSQTYPHSRKNFKVRSKPCRASRLKFANGISELEFTHGANGLKFACDTNGLKFINGTSGLEFANGASRLKFCKPCSQAAYVQKSASGNAYSSLKASSPTSLYVRAQAATAP